MEDYEVEQIQSLLRVINLTLQTADIRLGHTEVISDGVVIGNIILTEDGYKFREVLS